MNSFDAGALKYATDLIGTICRLAGAYDLRDEPNDAGSLRLAIERLDTATLFNWLMVAFSYQGLSDKAVTGYLRQHGTITWSEIDYRLSKQPSCPKLKSYWHFHGCRYDKTSKTCAEPDHYRRCPLPKHRLRNGRLNQTAYSFFLFVRDVMDADLVNWIDWQLSLFAAAQVNDSIVTSREALLSPLRRVFGVSDKVLSMALSTLLFAGQPARTHWHETGASMIAVDTLVHNFLHRTGILRRLSADHVYGPLCYGPKGCAAIIEAVSQQIDAREFNHDFPAVFPRFVQHAMWRYCSQEGLDVCNSNRIKDGTPCFNRYCRLFEKCNKLPIVLAKLSAKSIA
jgi:hypothetical protein